jgi:hypothetical protein
MPTPTFIPPTQTLYVVVVTATSVPPTRTPTNLEVYERYIEIIDDSHLYQEWIMIVMLVQQATNHDELHNLSSKLGKIADGFKDLEVPPEIEDIHDSLVESAYRIAQACLYLSMGKEDLYNEALTDALDALARWEYETAVFKDK